MLRFFSWLIALIFQRVHSAFLVSVSWICVNRFPLKPRLLSKLIPELIVIGLFLFVFTPGVLAATEVFPTEPVRVSGIVGGEGMYLNLSGYIAPFASIVLTSSDGIFLRSTVADKYGYFYITDVPIKRGFSGFCLDAIDFKRIGESFTCFNIPPAQASVTMKDIFLPPTLGLSRTEIGAGGSVTVFGYSMPGALVKLNFNGKTLTTYADSTGYYEFKLTNVPAGKYDLYATAELDGKQSLDPTRKTQLRALSWWEQIIAFLKSIYDKVYKFFSSLKLGPLWLGIPIIISIIILILRIWPEKFTFIYDSKLLFFIPGRKKKKKLHHSWFIGY
ncbi:carboxypeptidase-like regulatory domain-containing protein [Patescibacteria group bacterium]|nr:carboxypeptidase-like regulatory domain-containing protein [Patescibacteria group bacterium]